MIIFRMIEERAVCDITPEMPIEGDFCFFYMLLIGDALVWLKKSARILSSHVMCLQMILLHSL